MNNMTRISAAVLAATLLLGAGASAAMAEDAPAPVQQSNITPSVELLTEEAYFKGPSEARKDMHQSSSFPEYIGNRIDGRPHQASPPISAADGSQWVMIQTERGYQDEGWRYISQADISTSSPAGTFEAAEKLAFEADELVKNAHYANFDGTGTVKSGAGYYESEDTSSPPLAVATGLGFQTSVSEPFGSNGVDWRRISLYADGTFSIAYVLAADVTNYEANEPSAEPTEEPTITASEEAPLEMPAVPEGMDGMAGASIEGTEAGNDSPDNLGLMLGTGCLVAAAGGGYLYWTRRKDAGGAADAEGEGLPKE